MIGRLCEGEPGLVVDFEDLLDCVDVGGRPQVQAQVVLARCAHDLLLKKKKKRNIIKLCHKKQPGPEAPSC